jgi:hypothetical protein
VAGVDVQDREGQRHVVARAEGLLGHAQQGDGILAAAEQQDRPLELGHHLADGVDGLRLERAQLRDRGGRAGQLQHGGVLHSAEVLPRLARQARTAQDFDVLERTPGHAARP